MGFNHKSITDPLYGYVGLSELEADVVSSAIFQRLHNIRQLGLAHLVFPSAGYSRFAHSIGACHNAGRILDAIGENAPASAIRGKKKQAYRLAALLHDIGHYPFSHATEHAIQSFYVGESVLDFANPDQDDCGNSASGLNHEDVGKLIIQNDPELKKIFEKHNFNVKMLLKIFSKTDPDALFGLISSDLDCDRLDYLRRSAHGSGVPYGEVDVDFIISKATIDQDHILCFQSKAATAIDHFLISRFYDYMQIVYHKTVVGLEWSLDSCVLELLNRKELKINADDVDYLVINSEWRDVDDSWMLMKFKGLLTILQDSSGLNVICDHLRAVLYRKPAKLVYQWEDLLDKGGREAKLHSKIIRDSVNHISQELSIDPNRFKVIERMPFPFSSNLSMRNGEGLTYGEQARSVSILEKGKRKSTLLSERPGSIISSMSELRNFSVRVLYLPQMGESQTAREDIRKRFSQIDIPR